MKLCKTSGKRGDGALRRLSFSLIVLGALSAEAVNFPVGTYLLKGTLKDWQKRYLPRPPP